MSGQFLLTDSQSQWPATLTASANSEKGDPERGDFTKILLERYENCNSREASVASLSEIVEEIRNPCSPFCDLIGEIRSRYRSYGGGKGGKEAIRELKTLLPVVVFNARGSRDLAEFSNGIVVVDLDELGEQLGEARKRLEADPYCLVVFLSPSGDGLKALIKVPAAGGGNRELRNQHRKNFHAVSRYLKERWLLDVDSSCSDLMRLCFLSHDPDCSIYPGAIDLEVEKYYSEDDDPDDQSDDPNAEVLGVDKQEKVAPKIVEALLGGIPPRPDYITWLKIAAAVRNSVGDTATAIEILKSWSSEEHPGEYRKLLASSKFSRIGFGTLHYHARLHGFAGVLKMCFYTGQSYFFKTGGEFLPVSGANLQKHLKPFRIGKEMDDFMCRVRAEKYTSGAFDIAGYSSGMHLIQGNQILVKRGPTIIPGKKGGTGFINNFVKVLLKDEKQYGSFMSWLQVARKAVVLGRRRQNPALVIAGAAGDGKSLLIEIARHSLGGRSACAHNFLAGNSRFNADLARAELLYLDDNAASNDHTTRSRFAQQMKAYLFASSVAIEAKKETPIELCPVQALMIAVNDDPQHLRVLPEIDATMSDKIILLRTRVSPLPEEIAMDQDRIKAKILEDMPGWLYLVENYDANGFINKKNGRLICFKNPDLMRMLNEISPEGKLFELISQSHIKLKKNWTGTASQVQSIVVNSNTENAFAARSLLKWHGACGQYLAKLAQKKDGLVKLGPLTKGTRIQQYIINCGNSEESEECEECEEAKQASM